MIGYNRDTFYLLCIENIIYTQFSDFYISHMDLLLGSTRDPPLNSLVSRLIGKFEADFLFGNA